MQSDAMNVFDRRLLRLRRARAAAGLSGFDFLLAEVAERLVDRLGDFSRRFPLAVDLGCHCGEVARAIAAHPEARVRDKIGQLIHCDLAVEMARRAGGAAVAADEELLPFADCSLDLVISNFSLHWVNDLPGVLAQIRRALKPDGLFLAAMPGAETLSELRQVLFDAELAVEGGVSPRVSPFADLRDAGALLQRAGLALPVVDSDTITVNYGDPLRLMRDLRGMGESNALLERNRRFTRRMTLLHAASLYRERFGDADGRVPATFQVLNLTAWAPHESQQKPSPRGSATANLADALGVSGGKSPH